MHFAMAHFYPGLRGSETMKMGCIPSVMEALFKMPESIQISRKLNYCICKVNLQTVIQRQINHINSVHATS